MAGQMEEIKGYTIATNVFGRRDNFDQSRDPIVSIQANKLRRALERYYLVKGNLDPICITIPKGAYVPVFESQLSQHSVENTPSQLHSDALETWPIITVQSLDNQTREQNLDYIGIGIATEVALEITRYQEVRVIRQNANGMTLEVTDTKARFILGGSVRKSTNGLKVIVNLTDQKSGVEIWANSYHTDLTPTNMVAFEERVAKTTVGKILCECGIITKTLSQESAKIAPANLKTYHAILRFHQFVVDFSPQSFMNAHEALQQACRNEPKCGLIWSMLSRLYAINYSLELFDVDTSLEQTISFAKKGVRLEPENPRIRYLNAYILLLRNKLSAGLTELGKTLELNPNSLIYRENIGYLMTLCGDWQRGPALIRNAISQNPYYNTTVHHALWLDWVRQEQYDRAYEETFHFARPALFWDPLLKAAIFGLLGRYEEGKLAAKDLLRCKPDFCSRGHILIRHYIKQEDLVTKIISGLNKVGVALA